VRLLASQERDCAINFVLATSSHCGMRHSENQIAISASLHNVLRLRSVHEIYPDDQLGDRKMPSHYKQHDFVRVTKPGRAFDLGETCIIRSVNLLECSLVFHNKMGRKNTAALHDSPKLTKMRTPRSVGPEYWGGGQRRRVIPLPLHSFQG
jgi:hypothetical protein